MRRLPMTAAVLALAAAPALAAPLPPEVARMISAAAETGQLGPVADVARRAYPEAVAEIDAQVAALTSRADDERIERIKALSFREGWTGEGQAGGFVSSGNTRDVGVSAGLSFNKETLRWRHEVKLASEYQRSAGEVSKERYLMGYAGQWKLNGRAFVSLAVSGERDRFAGFRSRFSESVSIGYRVVERPDLRLDLQAGPALRQVDYYGSGDEIAFAARFGSDLSWTIRPDLVFTQNTAAFLDSVSSTVSATTALTTKLRSDLSARAAFDLRYESEPPAGRKSTDTTLRTSLVYSF
jgi:putative salt-induced outer membrane protein